jgi:putative ubiquitin-RnfH superfamily antitoxin RatB of RatAB toxin-antitoxin module
MERPESPSPSGRAARVEVACALPERQRVVTLELPAEGLTAAQAVQRSGLLQEFPQIAEQPLALAVFGVTCELERPLRGGDRVEILRPLRHDPRALRRERAAASRKSRRR